MEIRDLNYFRAVVSAGGVTSAAGLLHMSPGALSKALRRFEDDVGHKLLKRSGRNLVTTDVGRRLYERSERLLEEHASLLSELDTAASPPLRTLRLASFEIFNAAFMAHVLSRYLPEDDVDILEVVVGEIEQAVMERRVDYGITTVPFADQSLFYRRLGRTSSGIYGRPGAFTGVPFEKMPFIVPANLMRVAGPERVGIDGWPQTRAPRRVKYRVTMLQTGLELAVRGMAVFVIPDFVAALHNAGANKSRQLVRYPNPPGVGRLGKDVQLLCRIEHRNDPRTKELAATLRKALTAVSAMQVPTL